MQLMGDRIPSSFSGWLPRPLGIMFHVSWKPLLGADSMIFVVPQLFGFSMIFSDYATSIWTLTSVVSLLRHLDTLFMFILIIQKARSLKHHFLLPQRLIIHFMS